MLPFVALAPAEASLSIRAQLTRGVRVEGLRSLATALGVAADRIGLSALGTEDDEGGTSEVRKTPTSTGTLGQVLGTLGGLAAIAVVVAISVAAWRRPDGSRARLIPPDCAAVVRRSSL